MFPEGSQKADRLKRSCNACFFGGFGYRLTALVALAFCLLGGLVFSRFDEKRMLSVIDANKHAAQE